MANSFQVAFDQGDFNVPAAPARRTPVAGKAARDMPSGMLTMPNGWIEGGTGSLAARDILPTPSV
jgi:hypothetical protein